LARIISGYGNNGVDGAEGARYKNTYCTYMHGSFLPKNPQMADELIQVAIKRRTGDFIQLEHIDDEFETNARLHVQTCKK
jgi:CobQ-like glutamine amidotransferase family enzyme